FLCNLLIVSYKDTKNISFPQLFQSFSYTELTLNYLSSSVPQKIPARQTMMICLSRRLPNGYYKKIISIPLH
ncbi:hypothetical protein, partial [uncultured Bacteroides sp.]|uniref:hypothetical protein n=1 Tax=uncultured Bacteroides sp. TaxID=162156 RepID=UPI0026305B50